MSEARTAAEMGASVVVAQGREAGGHGLRYMGKCVVQYWHAVGCVSINW